VFWVCTNIERWSSKEAVQGMHVNWQGKDLTARCLVSAIHNIFTDHHRDGKVEREWWAEGKKSNY
jgi:hypothetical protein